MSDRGNSNDTYHNSSELRHWRLDEVPLRSHADRRPLRFTAQGFTG